MLTLINQKYFLHKYTLGCISGPEIGVKLSYFFFSMANHTKRLHKKISILAVKMNELRAFKNFLDQVKIMTPDALFIQLSNFNTL